MADIARVFVHRAFHRSFCVRDVAFDHTFRAGRDVDGHSLGGNQFERLAKISTQERRFVHALRNRHAADIRQTGVSAQCDGDRVGSLRFFHCAWMMPRCWLGGIRQAKQSRSTSIIRFTDQLVQEASGVLTILMPYV